MTPTRFAPPAPLELVSVDEMTALILDADAELSRLEARAAEATAAADHAEERAQALGIDERGPAWAMASLQRFLAQWNDEVDREAASILSAAREGARVRLDEARAEVARVRRAHDREPV